MVIVKCTLVLMLGVIRVPSSFTGELIQNMGGTWQVDFTKSFADMPAEITSPNVRNVDSNQCLVISGTLPFSSKVGVL